jgi:hypothetical protein
LIRALSGHTVHTAQARGWDALSNGALLNAAEEAGFERCGRRSTGADHKHRHDHGRESHAPNHDKLILRQDAVLAIHRRRARDSEIRGDGNVLGALDEIPKSAGCPGRSGRSWRAGGEHANSVRFGSPVEHVSVAVRNARRIDASGSEFGAEADDPIAFREYRRPPDHGTIVTSVGHDVHLTWALDEGASGSYLLRGALAGPDEVLLG